VRRHDRRGGATRVEFVCGGRALRDLRHRGGILARVASGLSVGFDEVEPALARLQRQEASHRKELERAVERLLAFEARELVAEARGRGGIPLVTQLRDDLTPAAARALANAVVREGAVAVLGVQGDKAQLLVARPAGVELDCGAVVRTVLTALGGRGGGQAGMAQGGVPDPARLADAVARAAAMIRGE